MTKIKEFGMAVFICIFNKDLSKVLLVKRNKETRKKYGFDWAIIGGKIELGEHSKEAIIREVKEEINVDISKKDLIFLHVKEVPKWFNIAHVAFFIYGAILNEDVLIKLNNEFDKYAWFDINNLPENRSEDDILELRGLIKENLKKPT